MSKINMKEDILDSVGKKVNTAIIIVTSDSDVSYSKFPKELIGIPQKLKKVIDYLDYDFDDGYGRQQCHDFFIYTKEEIFYIHEYDGSTYLCSIPRNPENYLKPKD